jgi:hypothetical protein
MPYLEEGCIIYGEYSDKILEKTRDWYYIIEDMIYIIHISSSVIRLLFFGSSPDNAGKTRIREF